MFLERRGLAGPGQVSLLTAKRALATARGSHLAQEAQLQPSPAVKEAESRLGWEITLPRRVCARQLCQQRLCF